MGCVLVQRCPDRALAAHVAFRRIAGHILCELDAFRLVSIGLGREKEKADRAEQPHGGTGQRQVEGVGSRVAKEVPLLLLLQIGCKV